MDVKAAENVEYIQFEYLWGQANSIKKKKKKPAIVVVRAAEFLWKEGALVSCYLSNRGKTLFLKVSSAIEKSTVNWVCLGFVS